MSKQIETRCIHGNSDFSYQEATKAVSFPIYQTATFGHIDLGGTESLITYPMVQTHPDVPQAMREHPGITETLLRLSVGLEHVDDIIVDLTQALEE